MAKNLSPTEALREKRNEIALEDAKTAREAANVLFRWTIGSLLLANGGALIALLGPESTRAMLFEGAGWLFVGGFLAALLSGLSNALFAEFFANAIHQELWSNKAAERDEYLEFRGVIRDRVKSAGSISFLLVFVAFIGFVGGCWLVSAAPPHQPSSNEAQTAEAPA